MLFNVAIGNTDDHLRNHAFMKRATDSDYSLSPTMANVGPDTGSMKLATQTPKATKKTPAKKTTATRSTKKKVAAKKTTTKKAKTSKKK